MDLESLVVGVIGMIAIVMAVTDFIKRVSNGTVAAKGIATQVIVWIAAGVVVFLYSASDFGTFEIGGIRIDNMEWTTKVILALAIGSAAMKSADVIKAIDGSDSAAVPPLGGPPAGV
jgi:hypothetical protein